MNQKSVAIIVEEQLDVSCPDAWKVITEHARMIRWFFEDLPDFKPVEGFSTQFAVQSGERTFTHLWTVTEVVPGRKIVYDWRYAEYPGRGVVIFELEAMDKKCRIRVTNLGLETFPSEIPEFSEQSCRSGWEWFIGQRLKEYCKKKQL